VILREASSGEELFEATLTANPDKPLECRWEIALDFTAEDNGRKIAVEIVAYDKMGNSGEPSIATVTLIIDLRPPVITDTWIQRTSIRTAVLEPYFDLKDLERSDPRGERSANANRYQNGWFRIHAKVNEDETRIENVVLKIYDTRDSDTPLFTMQRDEDTTLYAPRWLIKEEDILQAGNGIWPDYTANYDAGERYYYRVDIVAYDRAENSTDEIEIVEDQNYFCMWLRGDEPKGVLDPVLGTVVPRGTPLPVQFFDDDSIEWAYTDLFSENQWYTAIQGANDGEKLDWLKNQLVDLNATVYNWYEEKGYVGGKIVEQIEGRSVEEKWVYVETGNNENDYGEYVLFSLVKDKKLDPHTGTGPRDTNRDMWKGRVWRISVIDDNVPLIVFDTVDTRDPGYDKSKHSGSEVNEVIEEARTGDSPEENTFPSLIDGRFFEINGYTLRENKAGDNRVVTFRMAWIPYGMPDGADSHIRDVQESLKRGSGFPEGVQWWELDLVDGTDELIGVDGIFKKQVFRKRFDILGGQDIDKPEYNHFTYQGRENETKTFVFYAVDTMGEQHAVFRTIRLLGNKTPPDLAVYDISGKVYSAWPSGIPDVFDHDSTGEITPAYDSALKEYNEKPEVYSALRGVSLSGSNLILGDADRTIPYQMYTRGTILRYWVMAERSGELAISKITMRDITFSDDPKEVGSLYNEIDRALSFCESYSDVTQRVFLFEAEDTLGNIARIQRTIAITSAAFLENITTTSVAGSYGIGQEIILNANFSGQIALEGTQRPLLNIRYPLAAGGYKIESIQCEPVNGTVLALQFKFTVPEGADGKLETMYGDTALGGTNETRRPITLPSGTRIMDVMRNEPAFVPGYTIGTASMQNWTDDGNSLQRAKAIMLDGIRPIITQTAVGGKFAYQTTQDFYFKNDETINLTLSTNSISGKNIRSSGVTRLQYSIRSSTTNVTSVVNSDAFTYQRPSGTKAVIFSLLVNTTNLPSDGELVNVRLYTGTGAGSIVDDVGNPITFSDTVNQSNLIPANTHIYIKKAAPTAPVTTLNSVNVPTTTNYSQPPSLEVSASTNRGPSPDGQLNLLWEDTRQYSLNGGLSWVTYPNTYAGWTARPGSDLLISSGTWNLSTRYLDRAGNEGTARTQAVQVKDTFPPLISITVVQPNGTYRQGDTLQFDLNFAEPVEIATQANVSLTLRDRTLTANNAGGINPSYAITLVPADGQTGYRTSIRFNWPLDRKEMYNDLRVGNMVLTGLRDQFGNTGTNPNNNGTPNNPTLHTYTTITFPGGATCSNLSDGLKVDCIAPAAPTMNPVSGNVSADRKTITLTFNEPVVKGSGTITVRPRGTYAVPAVFENEGYSTPDGTWVAGFYDVYNNGALTPANRTALTQGNSMSDLTLKPRTGQSMGPYMKITQGLKVGSGYTGTYTVGNFPDNPAPSPNLMVPDTTTKWVLDYQYQINQNVAAINNIRTALNAAKWRWQEVDVSSSSVDVPGTAVVTITLPEPLLQGLQWNLYYPAGTFTDTAGNNAPAIAQGNYWLWSDGVQTPVIRVNRRSFDARTANWSLANRVNNQWVNNWLYNVPGDTTNWASNDLNINDDNGWGITDFNTVHYRIETETPDAQIYYGTLRGAAGTGSVTAAWTGNINGTAWNSTDSTNGTWVQGNLVRRAGNRGTPVTYTINGVTYTQTVTSGSNTNGYQGFRSYNKDPSQTELNNLVNPATPGSGTLLNNTRMQNYFTYDASGLQASKDYVVAYATADNGIGRRYSDRGYEGVFRSVVALNQQTWGGYFGTPQYSGTPANTNRAAMVEGSNIKNGMPSVAGFPVRDAEETGDNRFIKVFYFIPADAGNGGGAAGRFYWVSTEIVSQWYEIGFGGTHQETGEVTNYLTAGYGDLTYSYNQR
jgi:hypothetical protein